MKHNKGNNRLLSILMATLITIGFMTMVLPVYAGPDPVLEPMGNEIDPFEILPMGFQYDPNEIMEISGYVVATSAVTGIDGGGRNFDLKDYLFDSEQFLQRYGPNVKTDNAGLMTYAEDSTSDPFDMAGWTSGMFLSEYTIGANTRKIGFSSSSLGDYIAWIYSEYVVNLISSGSGGGYQYQLEVEIPFSVVYPGRITVVKSMLTWENSSDDGSGSAHAAWIIKGISNGFRLESDMYHVGNDDHVDQWTGERTFHIPAGEYIFRAAYYSNSGAGVTLRFESGSESANYMCRDNFDVLVSYHL